MRNKTASLNLTEIITDLEIEINKFRQERCWADGLVWTEGCITKDLYLVIIDTLLMSHIIQIEVALAFKHYFLAECKYEKLLSLKSLYIILLEGYKRIKGFSKQKENLWDYIRPKCLNNSEMLKTKIQEIDKLFTEFEQKDVFNRKNRDIFTHYDVNVTLYCDSLYSINVEDILESYQTMTSFLLNPLIRLLKEIKYDIESFCPVVKKKE